MFITLRVRATIPSPSPPPKKIHSTCDFSCQVQKQWEDGVTPVLFVFASVNLRSHLMRLREILKIVILLFTLLQWIIRLWFLLIFFSTKKRQEGVIPLSRPALQIRVGSVNFRVNFSSPPPPILQGLPHLILLQLTNAQRHDQLILVCHNLPDNEL